ncbi:hypothetical protein TSOC_011635 [Tetrabaena socialis]|uniref:Uncharacterized protein n=1 Tax=Tetrabaena socialis TaxID=47790 RepID=A0A2J7ZQ51_9CHLO|nr:hypothetical protein TSOC_011635 [Tetrabaena socialis]|eukprot:PNH02395.1 hypothetical protein TSOC_011635 [Tetrabaena socialis]
MRPCPSVQARPGAPGQAPGLQDGLRRACRGAPLVCRTAAPAWAERFSPAAADAPDQLRAENPDLQPSTSARVTPFVRELEPTRTAPSVKDTGTLRPSAEWYPAWMQYRRREDNYVFWQDKFMRCSTDIPCEQRRGTGRVHLLPPVARPIPRPTFFWLF